jgi:hypothetical protein
MGRTTLFCRQAGDMVVCMAYLERQPSRLVLWVAVLTAVTAVISLAMAITTLPHSGPYCRSDCVGYPYTDAAAFVPRDYLWMYPALVLTLLAVVLMESIHHQLALSRGLLSRIAVAFTTMGGAILVVDYASQLTFLQPALLLGETEGLSPWSQYNPHGIFIALENVGYWAAQLCLPLCRRCDGGYALEALVRGRLGLRLWRRAGAGRAGALLDRLSVTSGVPVRSGRNRRYLAGADCRAGAIEHRPRTDSTG